MKFVRNGKVQESSKIGQNLRKLFLEDQELGFKAAICLGLEKLCLEYFNKHKVHLCS